MNDLRGNHPRMKKNIRDRDRQGRFARSRHTNSEPARALSLAPQPGSAEHALMAAKSLARQSLQQMGSGMDAGREEATARLVATGAAANRRQAERLWQEIVREAIAEHNGLTRASRRDSHEPA